MHPAPNRPNVMATKIDECRSEASRAPAAQLLPSQVSIQSALTMLEREALAIWYPEPKGYRYAHAICLVTANKVEVSVSGYGRLEAKAEAPTIREAFDACRDALAETDPRMLALTLGIEEAA